MPATSSRRDEKLPMDFNLRHMESTDVESIVQLSLLAWEPVFASFEQILGSRIYPIVYPEWRTSQRKEIEEICREPAENFVWVAERDGQVVGFVAWELYRASEMGEVQFLAVHPAHQNVGIGTALSDLALGRMKESGMRLAVLGTGGDASHTPARRTYEKSGYTGLPLVRFYKDL